MTQNQTSNANKKISNYVTMIVLIVITLSIVSIILAANAFLIGDSLTAGLLAIIGLIALSMSLFTFYQSRRQVAQMKIEIPKVMTTMECKCGSKSVREFQRGDYVYKDLDVPCQKCPTTKQMITAI